MNSKKFERDIRSLVESHNARQNKPAAPQPTKAAQEPLIASTKVDKWLNELRQILVDRSEFKLADHVVSARVVIKMLENERGKQAAELERVKAGLAEVVETDRGMGQAFQRIKQQRDGLLEALKLMQAHYDDLGKSNPGFMGKLVLQDYGLWNEALIAMRSAIAAAEGKKTIMKATLYKTTGETEEVVPRNGTDFKLQELYGLIGTNMIEVVYIGENKIMVIDEEGKLKNAIFNASATKIFQAPEVGGIPGDHIVGNAVVMDDSMFK